MSAYAQAGPPFLSNDPGTPGNANWEINVASAPTVARGATTYQVPQLDINYGLGERIQLTYQVSYIEQSAAQRASGWSNAYTGAKWRFVDQGEDGWQVSTFPQVETAPSAAARRNGIASPGTRFLLPVEASKRVGPVDLDVEVGYYFPNRGVSERIIGLVVGHPFSNRLELDGEVYDDRASGALPHYVVADIGGRYKLSRGLIALFMAGRSVNGFGAGQAEFMGYFGIQVLLSDYGRRLAP